MLSYMMLALDVLLPEGCVSSDPRKVVWVKGLKLVPCTRVDVQVKSS